MKLNVNSFQESRRHLHYCAQANALRCLSAVLDRSHQALARRSASEALRRLVLADVTEALLAKAALEVTSTPRFLALERVTEREQALEEAMTVALFRWLDQRAGKERDLVDRVYVELCGTSPSL